MAVMTVVTIVTIVIVVANMTVVINIESDDI